MASIPTRTPKTRRISGKSVVHALAGKEKPYPAYKFSGRYFYEKPKHNPFSS